MNRKRLAIAAIVIVVIAAIAWSMTRQKALEVAIVVVERGTVSASVTNTRAGTIDACRRAGMSPAMGGQIASLPVHEGDTVEANQLLLELWNEDMRAELELAQRDAAAARSRARATPTSTSWRLAKPPITSARAATARSASRS